MPQLIWSPAALRDIQRLYRFIATKNPSAATRAVRAIREGMQIVAEHPEAGKPMESMAPEYREWLIGFVSVGRRPSHGACCQASAGGGGLLGQYAS